MPGGFRAAAQSLAFLPPQLPCSDHGGSSYSLSARCNVKLGRPWPAPREVHHSSMSGRRSGRNCLRAGHYSS